MSFDAKRAAWQLAGNILANAKGKQDIEATFNAFGVTLTKYQVRKVKEAFSSVAEIADSMSKPATDQKRMFLTISQEIFQRLRRSTIIHHHLGGTATPSSEFLLHILTAMEANDIECHLRERQSAPETAKKRRR